MTLVSRVLGLVREQVFAALLGAGYHSDAFRIAFRIPNLLRDLFAEGALSAAFVPTYARTQREGGREAGFALANRVLTLLAVLLGGLVAAAIVFAWPLVSTLAPASTTSRARPPSPCFLTRIMMPFLLLVSFAAVAMGMLNAEERFAVPALSPALFNVVTILWAAAPLGLGLPLEQVVIGLGGRARSSGASRSSSCRCPPCGAGAGGSAPSGRLATPACGAWRG
jgi:putative peptidoglycan lipid II flippase